VLGASLGPGDRPTTVLLERIDAAAALWRTGGAPVVIATGGVTRRARRAEADVVAEALRARGVPEVLVERESLTTAANAARTARLLRPGARVWLVTQPFHGRRAARLFRAAGLAPQVWHIADSLEYRDRRRALRWLVREYASWIRLGLCDLTRGSR
jgi:uncharacterized SAM-binding protein YcdF (DUF218 family)